MTTILIRLLTVIGFFIAFIANSSAGFINGDFAIPLTDTNAGWRTDSFLGDAPVTEGEHARFTIRGRFDAPLQLEQSFLLQSVNSFFSFEYRLFTEPSGGVLEPPGDVFQASLLDPITFAPLISVNDSEDRFFAIDSSGNVSKAAEVVSLEFLDSGFTRVRLDVSTLHSQEVLLDFFAFGEDDGVITTVLLDNVVVTQASAVIPEPGMLQVWGLLALSTIGLSFVSRKRGVRPGGRSEIMG